MDKKKMFILILTAMLLLLLIALVLFLVFTKKGPFIGTVTDKETGAPMQNVMVTDGRNVVKTDENGKFELKGWRRSHLIAITVPSGYITDDFFLPVQKETASYDFTLQKSELTAQENHSFLHISDTEIGADGTGEWLESVKDLVKEKQPAFLIHTGDICYEDGLKQHIRDMNSETMGCPVRYIIGNHDFVKGKYGEELYESIYGPSWYSFDVGDTHYVVTPIQRELDYRSGYSKNDYLKWLKNDLASIPPEQKVVMFNHTKSAEDDYVFSIGTEKLDLKEHNLIAWVFGHYHYNAIYETDGVLNISAPRPDSGGIDSSPAGTRLIHVAKDGKISTEMYYYDLNASSAPKDTAWCTKLEGNVLFTDTVAENGSIYTATADDDFPRQCGVYCLDAESGNIKWFYKTKNSIKNNLSLSGDKLVAQDAEGNVYCLDKQTGTLLWEKKVDFYWYSLSTSTNAFIKDNLVIAGNAAFVTALDLETGAVQWTTNRKHGEGSPAELIAAGDKLIVSSHWDALVALDSKTGKVLWENKDEDLRFRTSTPLLLDENTILATGDDAVLWIDANNGETLQKVNLEGYSFSSSGQPVVRDNIAYIPTSNKGVLALDLETKAVLWNFETEESILFTAPYTGKGAKIVESSLVLKENSLIFGANDGYIYTVDVATGQLIHKAFAGSAVLGKVAVTEDKLFAGAFGGYLVCYKVNPPAIPNA